MSDELDKEIERARADAQADQAEVEADRARLAASERRAELSSIRIQALMRAAELRPYRHDAPRQKADSPNGSSRGRQPGAISRTWRNILLATASKHPHGADEIDVVEVARLAGLPNTRPKDVRDRFESYQAYGYVEPAMEGWRVTPYAVTKFKSDGPDDVPDQADDEMETADVG